MALFINVNVNVKNSKNTLPQYSGLYYTGRTFNSKIEQFGFDDDGSLANEMNIQYYS